MASSSSASAALLSSPNPRSSSSSSSVSPKPQTLSFSTSSSLTFQSRSLRSSVSARNSAARRNSLVVRAFFHLAWVQTDRKSGGLGDLNYPLISDVTKSISKAFNVLIDDQVEEFRTKGFGYNPPPKHHLPPSSKTTLISPKPSPPPPISATNTTIHLQEKLIYLDSLGIDLIPLLTTHPPLISTPLPHIKSTISFLSTTLSLSPPALDRLVSLCPEVLTLPLPSIISVVTFLLREAHVSGHNLRHVIHRRPRLLTSDVKTRLRPALYFLQGTIGISEMNKHTHLLSCSVEDKFIPRIEYFHENIGISYDDTILIFRRFPSLFCYSIKENLEPKFNYFVVEMGRDLKELVEFPQYFSFSLENRIKQRHLRCVEKGVCLSLPAMLRSSEKRFTERLEGLPLVGNQAPDFEAEAVFDQEFIKVKLSEYIGKKYVILFFYPLDFTFVCPTEITAFSDRYAEFENINTEILGISVDSVFSHLAWVQTDRKSGGLGDLNYPLISDVTKSISKAFNVLIDDQGIALRGLFIIDKEGVIQHSTINNLAIGRSVDETLRTLQALQFVQENPDEVCPAGWKPGEKSMKPDPKGSKVYFAAI
ncbi:hypothetical protein SSX86_009145 [Deinandra increscens subsp. villosa]|uniref:thioredoxin-dependent peroxiredoxin n=2 Tax=Magnoliopsida TaxID=3398 RepID=A0AAP0DGN2_9ASTR